MSGDALQELGCDEVQGFLLGKPPLPANFGDPRDFGVLDRRNASERAEEFVELLENTR